MGFLDDDDFLDDDFDTSDIVPEFNAEYTHIINDPDMSVSLLAKVLGTHKVNKVNLLRKKINAMFDIFSDITLKDELNIYNSMISLCDKMEQLEKNKALQGKAVVGIGGQFSAGKSNFINKISGIGTTLVTDQKPTTAIPTYIVKSDLEKYDINTIDCGSIATDRTEVQALTHDFDVKYGFGFSNYVESIFIGSPNFSLFENIALLDTPGYSKNEKANGRNEVTDVKKAYEQLKSCDFLIWVAKMVPGITDDDIEFIKSLEINRPILFVLNQADLEMLQSNREKCLKHTIEQINISGLPCAGVTLYSSMTGEEYTAQPEIQPFFEMVSKFSTSKENILDQFEIQLERLQDSFDKYEDSSKKTVDTLRRFVVDSENIKAIRTIADMWNDINYEYAQIYGYKKRFINEEEAIKKTVKGMYNK